MLILNFTYPLRRLHVPLVEYHWCRTSMNAVKHTILSSYMFCITPKDKNVVNINNFIIVTFLFISYT